MAYFFEDLDKFPLGDLGLVVSFENEHFPALRTDGNLAAVSIPGKGGDTRNDAVCVKLLSFFHN